jgi:hypothetical protein
VLYLHSPICVHVAVLNSLRTGITLPLSTLPLTEPRTVRRSVEIFVLNGLHAHGRWVPVATASRVHGMRMEGLPPAVEGSCEYIE